MIVDPRLTPVRDGIASRTLEGITPAEVYLEPRAMVCVTPATAIRATPDASGEQVDQLLFGETFSSVEQDGLFLWGQAGRDGYVGFVAMEDLAAEGAPPTHRISALRTYAFEAPSIKTRARGPYSLGSLVRVTETEGRLSHVDRAGWIATGHLAPIGLAFESDAAAVAERFLGAPYLWGGRESLGLDCSGLVQQSRFACGQACPRDTDMQAATGHDVSAEDLRRGDLVFWRGHVAMMLDASRIIHANAWHMAVAIEPLAEAIARIGEPAALRRV
ncbi:NlpC/P60 family protein [Phenylobacterium immobile]|uniref:C40 family peptidase n=1 Tax=Phenylobacterium immobile TaxID=21 RepID=UPI000AE2414F|nr:NlpC/P60 family protein [Phenylobacterium immobile]